MLNIPKELKEFLAAIRVLNAKDIILFAKLVRIRRVKAGEILVRMGEQNSDVFLMLKGHARNYAEMANGDERTMRFTFEGMIAATPSSFMDALVSPESLVVVEDGLIAQVNRKDVEALGKERPNVQIAYVEELKKGMLEAHEHLSLHIHLSPEERYEHLMKTQPELLRRAQIKHLASFIGVTPVSLSRIRARLAKRAK